MTDRLDRPSSRGWSSPLRIGRAAMVVAILAVSAMYALPVLHHLGNTNGVTRDSLRVLSLGSAAVSPAVAFKVTVSANPSSVDLGDTSTLSVLISGGAPWFKYNWTALPIGCGNRNTSTLTCRPTEKGSFSVRVSVTDSTGRTASNSTVLLVEAPSSGNPFLETSAYTLYVFAALVGVVAAVATALVLVRVRRRRPPGAKPLVAIPESAYVPPHTETESTDRL